MAEIKGKMLICDICGKSVFLEYLVTNSERHYGGFGSYEVYEEPPEGWNFSPIVYNGVRNLCPDCSAPLNELEKKHKEEISALEEKLKNLMIENIEKKRK